MVITQKFNNVPMNQWQFRHHQQFIILNDFYYFKRLNIYTPKEIINTQR